MSDCPNPQCRSRNDDQARVCQACGAALWVGDRYRCVRLISTGGFGTTFLAHDHARLRHPPCVVKQFSPLSSNRLYREKAAQLFHEEALRLKELGRHPQIPKLLNYIIQDDQHYLVQEFIDGKNLETSLAEDGVFGAIEIRDLLQELLPVLQFVHDHSVIHRDIKPANLILPFNRDRLFLVDFGASKYATDTVLARTGTVIGSAGYAAPEQTLGKATFASDLYSLGVTCIHLFTGLHPFDLYSVHEDRWVWRDYRQESLSDRLANILDRLLERPLSIRYSSADQVLQDLNQIDRSPEPVTSHAIQFNQILKLRVPHPTPALTPTLLYPQTRYRTPDPRYIWSCQAILAGHTGAITALTLSLDGSTLVSGSVDYSIRMWKLATGELIHTWEGRSLWSPHGHQGRITDLALEPNSNYLLSASDDGTVNCWNRVSHALMATLSGHGWGATALAIHPQGQVVVTGSGDGVLTCWDLERRRRIDQRQVHRDRISALTFNSTGDLLISASDDQTLHIWNFHQNPPCFEQIQILQGHRYALRAIALMPDAFTVVSADESGRICLWDVAEGSRLWSWQAHKDAINALALNPIGTCLATGGEDSRIRLWDMTDRLGDRLGELPCSWSVNALAYSPDGTQLVVGSADATLQIWYQRDLTQLDREI